MAYVENNINTSESPYDFFGLADDVELVKSAQKIYHTYCRINRQKSNKNPIGVAIDRKTHRGQLLFCQQAILLPWENFIPIEKLDF